MPKEPDELGLRQAELVIVLQKEEGGLQHVHALLHVVFHATSHGYLVIMQLQKEGNIRWILLLGWCFGERMRDGERGWFPASCATEITNPTAMENNVQRMKRLRKETNV